MHKVMLEAWAVIYYYLSGLLNHTVQSSKKGGKKKKKKPVWPKFSLENLRLRIANFCKYKYRIPSYI